MPKRKMPMKPPKGMHKMPNGKMMPDKDMKKEHGKKKGY